jgi:2-phosphosulfolactate phosphatase
MKIDVAFSCGQLDELQLREKNIVVIDVLRSSTTVAVALHNGAREIIPVASIESAVKISGSLFGEVTLRGGERNGKMIDGFNLGNSPKEYSFSTVNGKSIIFCTTNGSVAMHKSRYARNLAIAAFVNVSAVVEFMKEVNNDFLFICSGRASSFGNFSLEDAVCAGMILQKLQDEKEVTTELSDSARASLMLYRSFGRSILKMLKTSDHGQYLAEIGFEDDLKLCAAIDSVPALPVLSGTVIKLKKEEQRQPELALPPSDKQSS